jgi:hypothetical protein
MPGEYRAMTAATIDLLHRAIADPDTQWSLGTFGAIAEFSRDSDEPVTLRQSDDAVSAVTARGGIAIRHHPRNRALASESITKSGWNQRVALCLSEADGAMGRRTVLTELGADGAALRSGDRGSVLFDLGFGAPHADFCVRIDDDDTAVQLRRHAGQAVFEPGNPAMGLILAANPHRVFISRLGRIEVDPAGLGQESRGAAHACSAEVAESRPDQSGDRAAPRGLGSLRASLSAASGARQIGRGPAVRPGAA